MKITEWLIVITCSLQYWRRTEEWSAILPFYSLDRRGSLRQTILGPRRHNRVG
jgi:hypothetical protein